METHITNFVFGTNGDYASKEEAEERLRQMYEKLYANLRFSYENIPWALGQQFVSSEEFGLRCTGRKPDNFGGAMYGVNLNES